MENKLILDNIIQKINENKSILIFVHKKPDPDALGSAISLKEFLNLNYPDKFVYILGKNKIDSNRVNNYLRDLINNPNIELTDQIINQSLGIMLDTPTNERVLTELNKKCKYCIKIDHHIKIEDSVQLEWVDDSKIATCEMLANLYIHMQSKNKNLQFNSEVLEPLYIGLLTDSNRFLYDKTTPNTFNVASWIYSYELDRNTIHNLVFNKSIKEKIKEDKIFRKLKIYKEKIGYFILKNKKIKSSKIYLLNGFDEFVIRASIYYDYESKMWIGSIRSNEIPIDKIANKYSGGGHSLASGFKVKTKKEFNNVLEDLYKLIIENESV